MALGLQHWCLKRLEDTILTEKGEMLLSHWSALKRREGRDLPCWQDISALDLSSVLEETWLLDYQPPQTMMVRYMGSKVVRFAGRDTTGKDFIQERIAPTKRAFMLALYKTVYGSKCGAKLVRHIQTERMEQRLMTTTFFPLDSIEDGRWFLLGLSELSGSKFLPKVEGDADFYSSKLDEPAFIDLGWGKPTLEDVRSKEEPYE